MLKRLTQERIIQYKLVHTYTQETYYSCSHLEIFICIYSIRGEIDQISTNTFRCTICSAPNVYMFVYKLIIAPIVPLTIDPDQDSWNGHKSFDSGIYKCLLSVIMKCKFTCL